MWTTPQAHDAAKGDPARVRRYGTQHGAANLTDDATAFQLSRLGPTSALPGSASPDADPISYPLLNPRFTEWLMGLPIGWCGPSGSGSSATPSFPPKGPPPSPSWPPRSAGRGATMTDSALMSSAYAEWRTPRALYRYADARYGRFTLDAAATAANALAPDYLDQERDALAATTHWTGRAFCNPPYGRGVGKWPTKAAWEVNAGHAELVCMLLAVRSDTAHWRHLHETASEVVLLTGRLTFKGDCEDAPPPGVDSIVRRGRTIFVCAHCGLRVKRSATDGPFDQHIYDPAPFPSALVIWRRGYYGPARYEQLAREVWR